MTLEQEREDVIARNWLNNWKLNEIPNVILSSATLPHYDELKDTITQLEKKLEHEKQTYTQEQEASADEFLVKLESIGMNFVVYHAGVGNLSIPVIDLVIYLQNPTAYVAQKCLVTEGHYRQWLQHYESPRCTAPIGEGQCCHARLIRTDSPSRFVLGQSDRCVRHQGADTAIINVLKFN